MNRNQPYAPATPNVSPIPVNAENRIVIIAISQNFFIAISSKVPRKFTVIFLSCLFCYQRGKLKVFKISNVFYLLIHTQRHAPTIGRLRPIHVFCT